MAGYEDSNVKKPIVLLGSGSGNGEESPLDQLKALCPDNHVAYGYIRMVRWPLPSLNTLLPYEYHIMIAVGIGKYCISG